MRKLLPYEHQLIESLGITKEEYLEFIAIQQEYRDPKVGTALDVRNTTAEVAIALTIIGTVFQVAAALLLKPEVPSIGGRRQRQQRFAPSFGFNSAQELARYGDPVNLVYTRLGGDFNPVGGVRTGGSLVWSSIENLGSRQLMQLQMVLGASSILKIDPDKTAFGQLALSTLDPGLVWIFYKNNSGDSGPLVFNDKLKGNLKLFPKDIYDDQPGSTFVCKIQGNEATGFSQAYSPTASTSLGVYDPIPLRVDVLTRNDEGKNRSAPINIKIPTNSWSTEDGDFYAEGQTIDVKFESSSNSDGDSAAKGIAKDIRRQTAEALTYGATYMLGAAKFQLKRFTQNSTQDVDEGDVTARFQCIERGRRPTAEYKTERPITLDETGRADLEEAERILSNNFDVNAELVSDNLRISFGSLNYKFNETVVADWKDEAGQRKGQIISKAGSIEYTKSLKEAFLDDRPTVDRELLINELNSDLTKAVQEIDDILNGEYDDEETELGKLILKALKADRKDKRGKRIGGINNDILKIKNDRKPRLNKKLPKNALKNSAFRGDNGGTIQERTFLSRNTSAEFKKVTDYEDALDALREKRETRRNTIIVKERRKFIKNLRSHDGSFTGLSGNVYQNGGIRQMEQRLKTLPSKGRITDRIGTKAVRDAFQKIINEKRQALRDVRKILKDFDDDYSKQLDNSFFVKCLVKCESASYETVSECNSVRFSIKSRLFRRVSGRQKTYGKKDAPEGYKNGDNGVKGRMGFFRVSYKADEDVSYTVVPVLFVIRHGAETDFYNQLNFKSTQKKRYSFKFDPVYDAKAETLTNGQTRFGFIENSEKEADYSRNGITFSWKGRNVTSINIYGFPNLGERGPLYTNEWDMFSVNTDTQVQFSHESGPEFTITAVTEQQEDSTYEDRYQDFSMLSIALSAGRGIQDLRNITAFVTKGKKTFKVDNFNSQSSDSTCFAPDIFVDTVLDPVHGVGKYTDASVLDQESLKLAKRFCINNGLPTDSGGAIKLCMDGIIADAGSWRSFWAENAPFSLLELARKNGADTLLPAIPVEDSGAAADSTGRPVPLAISALFTTGNILEGSYKEEFIDYGTATQDLIASVIYRHQSADDLFSTNRSVEVRRIEIKGSDEEGLRQTFDVSQFVTQREQAIMFGKLLVNQRKYIQKAIEFKTFPSEAVVEPGAFVYVDIGMKQWDSYSTGIVMDGGFLNTPIQDKISNGTYSFLFYDPNTGEVRSSSHAVTGNVAAGIDQANIGLMFVMGASKPDKRVYRVTDVAIEEDGEISVRAVEYPCFEEGGETRARIGDFRSSNFEVS